MNNFLGVLRTVVGWFKRILRVLVRLGSLIFRLCMPYFTLEGIRGTDADIVRKRLVFSVYHVLLLSLVIVLVLECTSVYWFLLLASFIIFSLVTYRYILYIVRSRSYLVARFGDVYVDSALVDKLLECRSSGDKLRGYLVDLGGWLFCTRLGLSKVILKSCSVEILVYCLDLGNLLLSLWVLCGVLGGYLLCHSLVALLGFFGYLLGVFWMSFSVVIVIVLIAVMYYLVNLLEIIDFSLGDSK